MTALLVGVYALLGGFGSDPWTLAWSVPFLAGVVLTLWAGHRPIGELRPVSFRPLYLMAGLCLMLWAVFMLLTTKDLTVRKARGKATPAQRTRP
jgi:hypothetical protein